VGVNVALCVSTRSAFREREVQVVLPNTDHLAGAGALVLRRTSLRG
jgi:hypothetical protein